MPVKESPSHILRPKHCNLGVPDSENRTPEATLEVSMRVAAAITSPVPSFSRSISTVLTASDPNRDPGECKASSANRKVERPSHDRTHRHSNRCLDKVNYFLLFTFRHSKALPSCDTEHPLLSPRRKTPLSTLDDTSNIRSMVWFIIAPNLFAAVCAKLLAVLAYCSMSFSDEGRS